jgi:protease I
VEQAIAGDYDALIFVGGPGTLDNLDNQISYQLITEAVDLGKLVAAICIATRILAHASVLENVAATGWNGDNQLEEIYDEYGVNYESAPVVIDQGFITATDPAAANDFADAIVRELRNK